MAEDAQNQAADAQVASEGDGKKLPLWVGLCVVVVAVASGAGYGVGQLLRPGGAPAPEKPDAGLETSANGREEYKYLDLKPITVNFNDPRLARYVRATITLATRPEHYSEVAPAVKDRLPELRNWLTVYLSSCKLDHLRGPKNLNRIRRDIEDAFNQELWPDQRPRIHHVLFKEFFVQ